MATTFNGWIALDRLPANTFVAPNGKTVYVASPDVAVLLAEVARRWHEEIEPIAQAYWLTAPNERRGTGPKGQWVAVAIHAWRPPGTKVGTGDNSNHRSGTGVDINGHLHPYEPNAPKPYRDGFTQAQRDKLRAIARSVTDSSGRVLIRLGIDFAAGYRDGMHYEIAPGVTAAQVKQAADKIRARSEYKPYGKTVAQVQTIVGAEPDGKYGPATKALVAVKQAELTTLGYAPGPDDGNWGKSTDDAWEAYMSEISTLTKKIDALAGQLAKVHQDVAARIDETNVVGDPAPIMVRLSARTRKALDTEVTSFTLPKAIELLLAHAYRTGDLLPVVAADIKGVATGIQTVAGPDAAKIEQTIRAAADAAFSRYQATFTRIDPEENTT